MFKLTKYLRPYWWQIIILCLAVILQVACTLQLPTMMADIVNEGIVPANTDFVWHTGFAMIGVAIVSAIGALVSSYFSASIGVGFSRDLRAAVYAKVLSFSTAETKQFSTASLITRTTNDVNQVQQVITMILQMMLRAPITFVVSIILAIKTAPDMNWIIVAAVVAILAVVVTIMSIVIPKFKIFQKLVDKVTLLTRENLTGLRVIRAFNNEKYEQKKFDKTNTELTRLLTFVDRVLEIQNPAITIIFNGTTLLCTWVGVSLLSKDVAYLGNMMAFSQYASQVIMAFLMMSVLFVLLPRGNVSAGRINEILVTTPKVHWPKTTKGIPDIAASVEFKNVDFTYTDAHEKMLDNISFVAKAGATTAFIGSTGSGKSTLVNLIPRFYEATAGEILVNGINIKDYAEDDLMKKIGFVPQRGLLFAGTVNSNIAFGAANATEEQIEQAAAISQSAEFIKKLPNQFASHISQGGTNVSGGQKQRLSIARAIAKKPDIYIFDDSFSALDMKTDAKLRANLKTITENSVVLIVAQRVNTIKEADQIIVLDNGKIAGRGTHYELLGNCPVYQAIVKSQLSDDEYKKELKNVKR